MYKNSLKKIDVVALGELLIDFTNNGVSDQGNQLFEANPGGAPSNVLSMLQNLGKKTAFIGKVGQDQFGAMLKSTLLSIGVNVDGLVFDDDVNTTLAFVHTAEDGERSFSFYRKPGADMMLSDDEIREDIIKESKIFHFGSLSMTDTIVEKATKKAIEVAKKEGALISFDPNLREPLWNSLETAREKILYGISQCDLLKISNDELAFITGEEDLEKGLSILEKNSKLKLLCVTLGKKGSIAICNNFRVEVASFTPQKVIDTTGAGDTFWACIINYVLEHELEDLDDIQITEMLKFANAAASIVITRYGALKVMPSKTEIENLY